MENKKELDRVNKELTDEYKEYSKGGYDNQIMWNSFVQDKLANMELRLRNLERAQGRADDYLNMHTPLM